MHMVSTSLQNFLKLENMVTRPSTVIALVHVDNNYVFPYCYSRCHPFILIRIYQSYIAFLGTPRKEAKQYAEFHIDVWSVVHVFSVSI